VEGAWGVLTTGHGFSETGKQRVRALVAMAPPILAFGSLRPNFVSNSCSSLQSFYLDELVFCKCAP